MMPSSDFKGVPLPVRWNSMLNSLFASSRESVANSPARDASYTIATLRGSRLEISDARA